MDCCKKNDDADLIIVDNLQDFNVQTTYINGVKVAENGISYLQSVKEATPNIFKATAITENDIKVTYKKR